MAGDSRLWGRLKDASQGAWLGISPIAQFVDAKIPANVTVANGVSGAVALISPTRVAILLQNNSGGAQANIWLGLEDEEAFVGRGILIQVEERLILTAKFGINGPINAIADGNNASVGIQEWTLEETP
jgi:hypothetical protein